MEVIISPRSQTLAPSFLFSSSSSSSSWSPRLHFPSSTRKEFLGFGFHLSLLGTRARRRSKNSGIADQCPRCLLHDYGSPVLDAIVAVAFFAAWIPAVYLRYATQRRAADRASELNISDVISVDEESNIMNQEQPGSLLGNGSIYSETDTLKEESCPLGALANIYQKDVLQLKPHTSVLTCEGSSNHKLLKQPDSKFAFIPTDKASSEITAAERFRCSCLMALNLGAIELGNIADHILDILSTVSGLVDLLDGSTNTFCAIPVNNRLRNINLDVELETSGHDSKLLVSSSSRSFRQPREITTCRQAGQVGVRSMSSFRSLRAEPFDLTLRYNDGFYSTMRLSPKRADVLVAGCSSSADYLGGRQPIACFREGPASRKKGTASAHGSARLPGRSLIYKNDNMNFSGYPLQNGNVVRDADYPPAYLRKFNSFLRDLRLKDCLDLLESMERKGLLDMEKVHHMSFLKACKSQRAVKEALRFAKLIRKPTLSTFNMLLSVCASSQDFEGAFQVMLLVKEAGLNPDCKLYTTLISTCAKCGKVDAMFEVFHEMVNAGVEPTVNTYGALIDGCARAGQVAKAFGAYGIMRAKKVQPDRVIFNALITACGQSGAVDRAFDVLSEMRAEPRPIDPDHVTVGALMRTCIQAGQVNRIPEVYKMLHLYNIKGTPDVYTIAVNSCSTTGDLNFALSIYDDMTKKGVVPDEMFLSTLIDAAGHAGKVDAAFKILQDAKSKGIKLGNVSYSSLMGACCNAKNWQKALELYEKIKAIKLLPTVSTLNALLTSLCDGDQLLRGIDVLDEMKEAGVSPNIITYSVLIVACERKDEAELGFTLFSLAKKDGVLPNLIMCGCLTGLCLRSFQKACSIGESVVSFNGGKPRIDSKWTSRAITTYRETIAAGVIPTVEVVSQVLGCLKFPHDANLRDKFTENMDILVDPSRCGNLCSLFDGFREYDTRCFSILEEAASLGMVPHVSFKGNPIIVDARKLHVHIVEVYILTVLKGLKNRLAAGARLSNVSILLPIEKTLISSAEEEKKIHVAGRVGQAVGSLLRRLGLRYVGDVSYGKVRISGLALRRWLKPKLTDSSSPAGKPAEMGSLPTRLAKGIADQQRSIRSSNNLSIEQDE